jgi:recombination protein RecT
VAEQQDTARREARQQQRQAAQEVGAAEARSMSDQIDRALGAIREDAFWTEILEALPRQMNRESFRAVVTSALLAEPKLLQANRRSLVIELMYCARMGLMPGGFGEVALFVDGKNMVQHRTEYGGLLKMAYNTGMVAAADAVPVYEGEVCKLSPIEKPVHEYSLKERGDWLGCYAYVKNLNGEYQTEWMTAKEIMAHAERYSEALRQKRQTPWTDPLGKIEMGCKTVLRRQLKYVRKSPEVAEALAHEDELDRAMYAKDVTGAPRQAIEGPLTSKTSGNGWSRQFDQAEKQDAPHDRETGEVGPASAASDEKPKPSGRAAGDGLDVMGRKYKNLGSALSAIEKAVTNESGTRLREYEPGLRRALAFLDGQRFDVAGLREALDERLAEEETGPAADDDQEAAGDDGDHGDDFGQEAADEDAGEVQEAAPSDPYQAWIEDMHRRVGEATSGLLALQGALKDEAARFGSDQELDAYREIDEAIAARRGALAKGGG